MNHKPYTNRLIYQKSPYLLQHAHNPVDWYPWGEDAFQLAKLADKPIFLSIGYATCHWCHVMEKESFEDPAVANLLNASFVNIKVDREELPEIDSIYMEFAQGMMSGVAGWPLNIILTPDLQPIFAATYLPPYNRHGLMGLTDLVKRIEEVWRGDEREAIMAQAAQVVQVFAGSVHVRGEEIPEREQLQEVADLLFHLADPVFGGMKGVPKFPIGYQYNFLLRYAAKSNESRGLFLTERTLSKIYQGGIFDHLGGGIARYSVDEEWLIPHFEKMIYDNALLSFSYLETWQLTKKPFYKEIAIEILNYILREMTHPEGGFYSAEDADSEGHEGRFYTWTPKEVKEVLGEADGELFCEFYGVNAEGQFEGRSVLHIKETLSEFALKKELNPYELSLKLKNLKSALFEVRNQREHPLKDDKILTSWNGLAIFSMVEAGRAFGEERYVDAAIKAAQFIKKNLWKDKVLYRRWRQEDVLHRAGLDDYAFLIRGLLSLFEADCGPEWIHWAVQLTDLLKLNFKEEGGAFYQTDGVDRNLLIRKCQFSDGAEPSGNAIHCENLLRLWQLTSNIDYLNQASDILKAIKHYTDSYAPGYCYHMMNLDRYYEIEKPTFVIALNESEELRSELMELLYQNFLPYKAIIWRKSSSGHLYDLIPALEFEVPLENKTTLYICYDGMCKKPLVDLSEMKEAIKQMIK